MRISSSTTRLSDHLSKRPETQWWKYSWQELPQERQDTRKRLEQARLQYAGTPESFESILATTGWRKAEPLSWGKIIRLFSPALASRNSLIFPQVHDGSHESLRMERGWGRSPAGAAPLACLCQPDTQRKAVVDWAGK